MGTRRLGWQRKGLKKTRQQNRNERRGMQKKHVITTLRRVRQQMEEQMLNQYQTTGKKPTQKIYAEKQDHL